MLEEKGSSGYLGHWNLGCLGEGLYGDAREEDSRASGSARSGAGLRAGVPLHPGSPKKGGRWDTASRKGPVSICLSAGSGFSRCSASSAISGSRPAVMPQPAPRGSTPRPPRPPPSAPGLSLPPAAGSPDASVATSVRAAPA